MPCNASTRYHRTVPANPLDLETLTIETFQSLVGEAFAFAAPDAENPIDVRLEDVTALGNAAPGRREPFALHFRGPAAPILPQSIYPVTSYQLGALDLFLVPIGRDAAGVLYEAIFT